MTRWFRFYDETINNPKTLRLSDAMFRAWVTLLCLASKNDGVLPPTKDIALVLRMKPAKVAEWLTLLTTAKLLDCQEDGTFRPHNWDVRQFKSDTKDETAAERMRRYRALRRNNRNGDGQVTVPRTETEQIQIAAPAASPNLSVVPDVPPRTEADLEKQYFDRGKEVLGNTAGGMLKNLLKSKQGTVALARAAIEQASTKSNPREYIGAVIRGKQSADEPQWLDGIPGVI